MNNKEIYKETFSCVQSTRKINLEESMKENKIFIFNKMYKYAIVFTVLICTITGVFISSNNIQTKTLVTNENGNITTENINPIQKNVINSAKEKGESDSETIVSINRDNETIIENYTDDLKEPDNQPLIKEVCYETLETIADRYDLINPIEVSDDGRLVFTLKGENIDITDLINTEISFTYEYIENDIKHLVIVGLNSDDTNDYGYAEYLNDGDKYFSMLCSNINFDESGSPKQQWLINAIKKYNISYKK